MFDARSICIALGSIFIAIGVLGFTENPLTGASGLFVTNTAHDLVHIFTGAGFLFGALRFPGHAETTVKIMGWVYSSVAILGFLLPGTLLFGLVRINNPDRWLHLVLAAGILTLAYAPWTGLNRLRRRGRLA